MPTPEEEAQAIVKQWEANNPIDTADADNLINRITAALKAREAAKWKQAIEAAIQVVQDARMGEIDSDLRSIIATIRSLESAAAQQKGSEK